MKEQLTNEEKARVFAMYGVCQTKKGERLQYCGHTSNFGYAVVYKPFFESMWCGWDEILIEVKPISTITYEHAFNVATKTDYTRTYKKENTDFTVGVFDERGFTIGNKANGATFFCHSLHWRQYEYLREEGYAVPLWFDIDHWANGKTAIELNIAIEKQS